jgi:hypothetical protein
MLGEAYSNGERLRAYMRLLGQVDSEVKTVMEDRYPAFVEKCRKAEMNNRSEVFFRGTFLRVSDTDRGLYKRYKDAKCLYEFEQQYLGIEFYIDRDQYMSISNLKWGAQYLFSSLSYEKCVTFYKYKVDGEVIMVNQKDASLLNYHDCDEQMAHCLVKNGIVAEDDVRPFRERIDNGQMKICCDLILMSQMIDRVDNVKLLVVGSASEAYGSGRSYYLLDYMFRDSIFDLYDPFEIEGSYRTDNGNVYNRHAQVFDYSTQNVKQYDLVQDDAFVSFEKNRFRIDPLQKMFDAGNFACKWLKGDEDYFRKRVAYGTRQVGKTSSKERRAYSKTLQVVNEPERKFGHCDFCRELTRFVPRGKYDEHFFKKWFSMHKPGSTCSKEVRMSYPQNGHKKVGDGMFFIEKYLPPAYCLSYDIVERADLTHTVDPQLGCYVFSSLGYVSEELREKGKYAIYDRLADVYYCSWLIGTIAQQISVEFDMIEAGIKYREVVVVSADVFDGYLDMNKTPKIVFEDVRPAFNYYKHVFIERRNRWYMSLPKT